MAFVTSTPLAVDGSRSGVPAGISAGSGASAQALQPSAPEVKRSRSPQVAKERGGGRREQAARRKESVDLETAMGLSLPHEDMEGANEVAAMTATTFIGAGTAAPAANGSADQKNTASVGGIRLTKEETIYSVKGQLYTYQQLRILASLVLDTGGQPLALQCAKDCKATLVNYSRQIRGNPGHGLGPSFIHGCNAYCRALPMEPEWEKIEVELRHAWTQMLAKWTEPKLVPLSVKGFSMKTCHGNIEANFAITIAPDHVKQRECLLKYWMFSNAKIRVGPAPPGPFERKAQRTLERPLGPKKI